MSEQQPTQGVVPPPPGVTPNFDHPERRLDITLYIVSSVGMAICTLCLAMRVYTKQWIKKAFGIEDVCIILAWVFSLATQGIIIYSFAAAGEGMHLWEMRLPMFTVYQKVIMAASVIYVPCLAFAKLSLLFLYHRLSPQRHFRTVVHIVMCIVAGYSFALIFVLIFSCRPIQMGWDAAITDGECVNRPAVYIATAIVNIVTDLCILVLPIPMVAKLKMPKRQKLGLLAMFIIGSATVITSIVRLVTLFPLLTDADASWAVAKPAVWIVVEANLVIVCGCLPAVRQFLQTVAPRLIGENSTAQRYGTGRSVTLTNNNGSITGQRKQGSISKPWTAQYGLFSSTHSQSHEGRERLPDDIEMNGEHRHGLGGIRRTTETTVVSEDGDSHPVYGEKKMWKRTMLEDASGSDDDGSEKEIIGRVPIGLAK